MIHERLLIHIPVLRRYNTFCLACPTSMKRKQNIAVRLITSSTVDVFDQLKPEWNDLLGRSSADNIFSTWEWQSSWWAAYEAGELWMIACRDDQDRLVALAPWFIQVQPDGERVVRSIGCVDVTDYVDVIVEPEYAETVYPLLAAHLREHRDLYDRINLCNIPEASPTLKQLGSSLEQEGFEVEIEMQEVCPVIKLPATYEDYLAQLDKKQRHELRRKVRRAESEAVIGWYIVGKEHDVNEELEYFLSLMASSQQQKAEFLSDPKNVAFFKRVMPLMYEQGWLQLNFLCVNGERNATYLNFDYNDRILVYNSGLRPDAHSTLSSGIVLLTYNIQHAIELGRGVFDFLRGNETYKYRMGAEDTRVFKVKAKLAA